MPFGRRNSAAAQGESRSAIRFVAPVLISLTVMLIAAVISMEVLSTMRAWVGGESLYSKGQKNAVYYLAQYAQSRSEDDYRRYLASIAFPLGDRQARLALLSHPQDLAAARAGFLIGGSDPADIDSIILLFRLLGGVPQVREAIEVWTEGDAYTMRLRDLAARLHPQDAAPLPPAELAQIRAALSRINAELTPLSARFAETLGRLARLTRSLLIASVTIGTVITGLMCIHITRARVRERDAKERRLARLTELYAALSQTSQLISRVDDRGQLFDELCRICVGTSGLALAAVGLLKRDRAGLEFCAAQGEHREYLERLAASARDEEGGEDLRRILRAGRAVVSHAERPSRSLFPSVATFPLRCQHEIVGVLCVFSGEYDYFRKDMVDLLEQLAMEASFALDGLHREAERRRQAAVMADQNRILSLIASGAGLPAILTTVARFVEAQSDGRVCVVKVVGAGGSAGRLTVAPSLSEEQRVAIDAADDDGAVQSSCAGFSSVTEWPIFGSTGLTLGALSLYGRDDAGRGSLDERVVGICTNLAGIAIESCRAAERIKHLAHHDDLTGLPNRLLFGDQLPLAIARAKRTGAAIGVLFLDLDRFKIINDTLGHDSGDTVLCQVARHLRECVRDTDVLARVGGDEFTLIVEQYAGPSELGSIAQKLLAAMSRPVTVRGEDYHLSGSIGISIYPKDGTDSSTLLKNADIAMYRAKTIGRNTYQFYSDDIDGHSVERLALENELRQAVARGEIEVHYQPKVDVQTGRVTGAEALVRWRHPQRGLLLPRDFIVLAEEVGFIGAIGNSVLHTVCADAARWRDRGLPTGRIAINLSARQFADSRLIDDLNHVLLDTGCDPQSLEFEITESVVMTHPERALHLLEQIKSRGITLAIDDFGTGHSSLAHLKRFPVDIVKIDRTFVRDIATDANDLAITRAIIALGHSLDLRVIAEGVETDKQLEILRRHHCDEYQGFLFSAAVPAEQFERILEAHAPASAQGAASGRLAAAS